LEVYILEEPRKCLEQLVVVAVLLLVDNLELADIVDNLLVEERYDS
jgi:hypothetical protein